MVTLQIFLDTVFKKIISFIIKIFISTQVILVKLQNKQKQIIFRQV